MCDKILINQNLTYKNLALHFFERKGRREGRKRKRERRMGGREKRKGEGAGAQGEVWEEREKNKKKT